jgi:hypothetical protein
MPDIPGGLEKRTADVSRVNTHGVKLQRFTIETTISGVGEALVTVNFPLFFIERPAFSSGLILDDNINPVAGIYPTFSAVVSTWIRVQKQGENVGYFYRGATVAVVLEGDEDQQAILQTHFEGKAFRNPTAGTPLGGL